MYAFLSVIENMFSLKTESVFVHRNLVPVYNLRGEMLSSKTIY